MKTTADSPALRRRVAFGAAYMTDLGMCGSESASVLGMEIQGVIKRFITGLPVRFAPASGEGTLNGLVAEFDPLTGKAKHLAILREKAPKVYDPASLPDKAP